MGLLICLCLNGDREQVTLLWEAHAYDETFRAKLVSSMPVHGADSYYRAVLYLRPDLQFYDDLVVDQLLSLSAVQVLTPKSYAHGLNDR